MHTYRYHAAKHLPTGGLVHGLGLLKCASPIDTIERFMEEKSGISGRLGASNLKEVTIIDLALVGGGR